jgi:hypothetical protein
MVLSVEESMLLVEHVFWCGGEYTQDVQQRFQAQFLETKVPHLNAVRQLKPVPYVTLPDMEGHQY